MNIDQETIDFLEKAAAQNSQQFEEVSDEDKTFLDQLAQQMEVSEDFDSLATLKSDYMDMKPSKEEIEIADEIVKEVMEQEEVKEEETQTEEEIEVPVITPEEEKPLVIEEESLKEENKHEDVKRCHDKYILSGLQVSKIPLSEYSFADLIEDIKFLNPKVDFKVGNEEDYKKIYINCDIDDLVLPEPFYFGELGFITNKGYEVDGNLVECLTLTVNEITDDKKIDSTYDMCDKHYNVNTLVDDIKLYNPGIQIEFVNEKNNKKVTPVIYSEEHPSNIKLPKGFYYDDYLGITNLYNSIDFDVTSIQYKPMNEYYKLYGKPKTADLTNKKQKHNTEKTSILKRVSKKIVQGWKSTIEKIKKMWSRPKHNKKKQDDVIFIEEVSETNLKSDNFDTLTAEIKKLNEELSEELKKGSKMNLTYVGELNDKISLLVESLKLEKDKMVLDAIKNDKVEEPKEKLVEEDKKEEVKEEPILIEDITSKKIRKYSGYSMNALEKVYNSLEAVMIDNEVLVREKDSKFIINDQNILLKYQVACIWKSISDKLGMDAFSKDSKYLFNQLLVGSVNSLSTSDNIDKDLVIEYVNSNISDYKAVEMFLNNSNTYNIINKYANIAKDAPVSEIDKCHVVAVEAKLDPNKVQKTEVESFALVPVDNKNLAKSSTHAALIRQVLKQMSLIEREHYYKKIDDDVYASLMELCKEKIAVLNGTRQNKVK